MRRYLPPLARFLIALIFLMSGFGKVMDPAGTQAHMAQYGMPLTGFFLTGAVLFELGGGLSLLLGWKARWAATVLFVFLIPTTLIFHTDFADQQQLIFFLHNLALMGGLLLVVTHGAGRLSLDGRRNSTSAELSSTGAKSADATARNQQGSASRKPVEA